MANIIDRVISYISPEAGLRRLRARAVSDVLLKKRSYDGATKGRRADGWTTTGASASAEIRPALADLRNRSRELVRNNPYATRAVDTLVANIVGTGVVPKSQASAARTRQQQKLLWDDWTGYADFENDVTFYGLQALAVRTLIESGEVLVRRHINPQAGDIPLQFQVLEPDYIDNRKNELTANGGFIIDGVEFDKFGRKIAYWLYNRHPGDTIIYNLRDSLISTRVPATEIIHLFKKLRPGQYRGVPWFAPTILTLHDLDEYEDAELLRKKIEACFVAFVTQPDGIGGDLIGKATGTDSNSVRTESFEPGMIEYMRPGEQVEFGSPSSNSGYNEYISGQLRKIASGVGVMYEQITGDLTRVNYSSYRAGSLEFRRAIELFQHTTFIPGLCVPIRNMFIDVANAAGKLPSADKKATWTTPKWDWVDPEKDVNASILAVRNGFMSMSEVIRQQGYDRDEVFTEQADDLAAMDALNLTFDSDPRKAIGVTTASSSADSSTDGSGDTGKGGGDSQQPAKSSTKKTGGGKK